MRDHTYDILNAIYAERIRQEEAEGFSPEHDDELDVGELGAAAAAYALHAIGARLPAGHAVNQSIERIRPWPLKVHAPRRALIIAGALLMAEIERIDRRDGYQSPLDRTDAGSRRFDRLRP